MTEKVTLPTLEQMLAGQVEAQQTNSLVSRRKMLGMGIAGGAAALLATARPAQASGNPTPGTNSNTPHYISVTDYFDNTGVYPAEANMATVSQAKYNTEAFRNACASAQVDYSSLACPIEIYIPAGDWYLWEGFAVPLGCTLRGAGSGATRLIIPVSFNPNPGPVVSLGSVLASKISATGVPNYIEYGQYGDAGEYIGVSTNDPAYAYLQQPNCLVEGILINSPNGIGIDIRTAGWVIQDIWIFAANTGIQAKHDGIISNIIVDSSTAIGVMFNGGQDILVDNLYVYNTSAAGVQFLNSNDSIRFSNTQICFPLIAGVVFAPGANSNNITFDGLSILGNNDNESFVGGVNIQGNSTSLTINGGLFSNTGGYGIYGGGSGINDSIILNNCTFDGSASNAGLAGIPNSDPRTPYNHRPGGIVYGHINLLKLDNCRFINLSQRAVYIGLNPSSNDLNFIWSGGFVRNCNQYGLPAATEVIFQANRKTVVSLSNIIGYDSNPLFQYVANGTEGVMTGRFVNCAALSASRDVIWVSATSPTLQAITRNS